MAIYAKYFKYHPGIFFFFYSFLSFVCGCRAESETGLLTISRVYSDVLGLICHFFHFCRSERHIKKLFSPLTASIPSFLHIRRHQILRAETFIFRLNRNYYVFMGTVSHLDASSVPFRWCLCWFLFVCMCQFVHSDRFIISSSPSNERNRASERKRAIMTAGVTIDI